ncbi:unnamed protein product, partial [Effrenium voratum]
MSDYLSTGGVRSPEILVNAPRSGATPVSKDELFLEGYGRQFGEKMTYSVGMTYGGGLLTGGFYGGLLGIRQGGATPKLFVNSVLNSCSRYGPALANQSAIITMYYVAFNGLITTVRGSDDPANAAGAGAFAGALYKVASRSWESVGKYSAASCAIFTGIDFLMRSGVLEKFSLAPREFSGGDEFDDNDEVNLTLMKDNGQVKVMIMYSSEIQDLKGALECVHTFVEELAASYAPFVAQTAQALLPVFDFCMEDGIRDLAFETWGQLCRSAREGGQVQIVSQLVMEFLKRVLPKFEAEKVNVPELKTSAEGVTACLKEAGPGILQQEQLRHICKTTLAVMAESFQRRDAAAKGKPPGVDEDGDEHDDDEEEDEQAMRIALCEVAGSLMQHHADMFIAESFSTYLNLVVQWLQPNMPKEDRKLALFVMCDFLEHLGQRVTSQWPQFVPKLLEDLHNPDPDLRQPACYAVYLAAKIPEFAPLALDAANKLCQVVTQSRQRSKKKSEKIAQACADNALSGLGEILLVHQQAVMSMQAQLWQVWVGGLPCREDDSEGVRNHRRLLEFIQQEKKEVVGEGGQNVPKLFGVLVDVYKTDMADEETSKGIGAFALLLGESKLESFAAQFSEKQRKKLLRIVREAVEFLRFPWIRDRIERASRASHAPMRLALTALQCRERSDTRHEPALLRVRRPVANRLWLPSVACSSLLGASVAGGAPQRRGAGGKARMARIDRVQFLGTGSAVPVPGRPVEVLRCTENVGVMERDNWGSLAVKRGFRGPDHRGAVGGNGVFTRFSQVGTFCV